MENDELISVLSSWNFWGGKQIDTGLERPLYVDKILNLLKENNVIAETGIRRCGKSFIARQAVKRLIKGADGKNVLIINLEDERFISRDYGLLLQAYESYKSILKPDRKPLIVIDEAQEVEGWEKFVRGLTERNEAKFIITGSSSKLLSSEYSTLLSGRQITLYVAPLSFPEFLAFKGMKTDQLNMVTNAEKIRRHFDEYLHFGGFPVVALNSEKNELLLSYFDTIMVKDVISRYKLRNEAKLRSLAKFYLTNIASEITYNSVSRFLNIPVKTAQRFSEYIASSSVIFFVDRLSFSPKEKENSPRKVYSIDNGIASAIGTNFMEIRGRMLENIVAQHIYVHCKKDRNSSMYYWREKGQGSKGKAVDFVIKRGNALYPIQVSYSIRDPKAKEREISALIKCAKELNVKKCIIITYEYSGKEKIEGISIEYKKAYNWLMDDLGKMATG